MQARIISSFMRPTIALADYDFLRATYDVLLRAPAPNQAATDAAQARLRRAAHFQARKPDFMNWS